MNLQRLLALFAITQLLVGCSSGYAPITDASSVDRTRPVVSSSRGAAKGHKTATPPEYYRVQKGDTLYSIAWRYGLDFRKLAAANNIGSQYLIKVGQRLRLATVNSNKSIKKNYPKAAKKTAAKPSATSVKAEKRVEKQSVSVRKATEKKVVKVATKSKKAPPRPRWQWPVSGSIIRKFSSENKGINISGEFGGAVKAAADGRVVYAGSGILGYGNLVIINHNYEYLSAYAHNSKLHVKENETVKAGTKIAEIGNSSATRTMLHFEIRKDGKPVNPLRYLPKR